MKSLLEIIKVAFISVLLLSFMLTYYSYAGYKKEYSAGIWMYDNGLAEKIDGIKTVKEMYLNDLQIYPLIIRDFRSISYLNLIVIILGLAYFILKKWLERTEKSKSAIK